MNRPHWNFRPAPFALSKSNVKTERTLVAGTTFMLFAFLSGRKGIVPIVAIKLLLHLEGIEIAIAAVIAAAAVGEIVGFDKPNERSD